MGIMLPNGYPQLAPTFALPIQNDGIGQIVGTSNSNRKLGDPFCHDILLHFSCQFLDGCHLQTR